MYLFDSSVLIKWLRRDRRAFELFSSLPQKGSYISEITAFEILIGARSKQQLEGAEKLLAIFERIPVSEAVVEAAVYLCMKYPQIFDRKTAHTLFDAFIAATGLVKNLAIITLNIRQFAHLKEKGLKIRILDSEAKKWI